MPAAAALESPLCWDDGDPLLAGPLERLGREPAFASAVRTLAGRMLGLFESDPAIAGIFKDAGRYVAAMVAASMRKSGVTLPRLKEMCASFGLLSRGRAHALLAYLLYLGYVEPWPERRPPRTYRVSASFVSAWRRHLQAALEGAALIDPLARHVADRLDDPDWLDRFTEEQMRGLRESLPALADMPALATVFLDRHGGSPLLWTLITRGNWRADASEEVSASGAGLAARFGVSRMHVSRLLRAARQAGLIDHGSTPPLRLTPLANAQIAQLYGMQIARLLVSCERTVAALEVSRA